MAFKIKPVHVLVLLVVVFTAFVAVMAFRESLTDCADGDGGIPCKRFGCEWIDKNSFGTAKVCDCRNCEKCIWDETSQRCLSRDKAVDVEGTTYYEGADVPQDLSDVVVGYERSMGDGPASADMDARVEQRKEEEKSFFNLWGLLS